MTQIVKVGEYKKIYTKAFEKYDGTVRFCICFLSFLFIVLILTVKIKYSYQFGNLKQFSMKSNQRAKILVRNFVLNYSTSLKFFNIFL